MQNKKTEKVGSWMMKKMDFIGMSRAQQSDARNAAIMMVTERNPAAFGKIDIRIARMIKWAAKRIVKLEKLVAKNKAK